MAEVINLRQARKARARIEAEKKAAANRVKFGRTRAEKAEQQRVAARLAGDIEGAKRDRPDSDG